MMEGPTTIMGATIKSNGRLGDFEDGPIERSLHIPVTKIEFVLLPIASCIFVS